MAAIYQKTDNANLQAKLTLRRHLLDRYPPASVFDCCQGSGEIWAQLLTEYPGTEYFGVDVKPKKGRLRLDSIKLLAQPGWQFDVIDVDTYGSPWRHWQQILTYAPGDVTVFLTIGLVRIMGGQVAREIYDWLGFSRFIPKMPPSLASQCNHEATLYALDRAKRHGFTLQEVWEAPEAQNARYIGLRLQKET